jgi:hypothetical protein
MRRGGQARARIAPAQELYTRHSSRIAQALRRREISFHQYALLSFLVDEIDLPGRSGEADFTLEDLRAKLSWERQAEHLRRQVHELRHLGWIDFDEPRRGPEAPWIIRLTGAGIDGELTPSTESFHREQPPPEETHSSEVSTEQPADSQPESAPFPPEFPPAPAPRAEQSRAEAVIDEKLDHDLGTTTTGGEQFEFEQNPFEPDTSWASENEPEPPDLPPDAPEWERDWWKRRVAG